MARNGKLGEILYKIGIIMAVSSVIGGFITGWKLVDYLYPYSSKLDNILFGLALGVTDAAFMLLIAGFGKLISDVDVIRKNIEAKDGSTNTTIDIESI